MNCLKCGQECMNEDVFCQNCLLEMEKYPIRPGTVVLLPRKREPAVIRKTPKRHGPTAEEQIKGLRKQVFILTVLLILCMTAIVLMFKPTMHYVLDEHVPVGQNYSSVATNAVPTTPDAAE